VTVKKFTINLTKYFISNNASLKLNAFLIFISFFFEKQKTKEQTNKYHPLHQLIEV